MSCGHRVVGITNGHSIHAGPWIGTGVSIYVFPTFRTRDGDVLHKIGSVDEGVHRTLLSRKSLSLVSNFLCNATSPEHRSYCNNIIQGWDALELLLLYHKSFVEICSVVPGNSDTKAPCCMLSDTPSQCERSRLRNLSAPLHKHH